MRTRKRNIVFEQGEIVNGFTFIEDMPSIISGGKPCRIAKFICHCGNEFTNRLHSVKKLGMGCGCKMHPKTHGYSRNKMPEYKTWIQMKQRCYNKNSDNYDLYGGRGITVCDRWLNSFETFLADMGHKPSKEYTIDRENVNGHYEPSNCKWATPKEQSRNKRNNVLLTYNGETLCVSEWCERLNINKHTVLSRINKQNWSIEKALSTPIDIRCHSVNYLK